MGKAAFSRTLAGALAFALIVVVLMAISAVDPARSQDAEAQSDSTITAIQTPPPVPGIDYDAAITEAPAVASPPAGTADVGTGENALSESDGGYSTSLGGSDVAVASEGESHQVDGPKRRVNRLPVPRPRP